MSRRLSFILMFLLCSGTLAADEVRPRGWLHLNGYTHHFAAPDANADLFGLGGTWYVQKWGRTARAWEADVFQDSGRKLSAYVGHSWTYRMRYANAGVTGALMYHRNFGQQNDLCLLPVALPYAELSRRNFSIRAYYIPPVRSGYDHQISFQVLVPLFR